MSKYQQLHQEFLADLDQYQLTLEACLSAADGWVRALANGLEWDEDDVEYLSFAEPHRGKRLDLDRSNLSLLERLAEYRDNHWHFGVRWVLRSRRSPSGRFHEVGFVLPLWVQNTTDGIALRTALEGPAIAPDDLTFADVVVQQIEQYLRRGIQQFLSGLPADAPEHRVGVMLLQERKEAAAKPNGRTKKTEPTPLA
ncbi:MAG: hypothetical protein HC919_00625 [Oscillatoriales cyanobacterium SM2_2_1]|nr:hypothetical protein [Oscillatoriales cyanobacterium SM2_2_1]